MPNSQTERSLSERWERRIIIGFRIFTITYLVAASFTLIPVEILYRQWLVGYLVSQLIIPGVCLIAVNAATQLAKKYMKSNRDYMYIVSALLLCIITIYFNPLLHAIQSVLLLPVMVAIFFLDKRKVIVAGVLSVLAYLALYYVDPYRGIPGADNVFDLVAFAMILVGETLIAVNIMDRGVELWSELKNKSRIEQELRIQNILVEKDAKTDALTGLNNRKSFNEYLECCMQTSRDTKTAVHLAVIDIDNFKHVNDEYGHLTGDMILVRTAKEIERRLPPGDFPARYGGEEFAVIILEKTAREAFELAEQIRTGIASIVHEELGGRPTTVSIGLAMLAEGEDAGALFARADECLYMAKRAGKNQTVMK